MSNEVEHPGIGREDVFPGGDELRFGSAEVKDIERRAKEGSAIDLAVFVNRFDAINAREDFRFIMDVAVTGEGPEREGEIKFKEDISDVEKKGADHRAQ